MSDNEQLKTCPFCGGVPLPYGMFVFDGQWGLHCSGCSASVRQIVNDEKEIIAAWNRRPGGDGGE